MADARFAEGAQAPLRLLAQEAGDVPVLSALLQDAVLTAADLAFDRRRRRFAALVNRLRWEDRAAAGAAAGPAPERVRSLLTVEGVVAVRSSGIARGDGGQVLSLLETRWQGAEDGTSGRLSLVLAGEGEVELTLDALEAALVDVSRPWAAASGRVPDHGL